jgi:hypothetical protein
MKALFLGSTSLTILIRCTCRRRCYFARAEWHRLGFLLCDNCSAWIRYNDLTVMNHSHEGDCKMHEFKETKARSQIIAEFNAAQAALESAAKLLREIDQRERAHETINIAQSCASKKSLLSLDWSEEDAREPEAGEQEESADAGNKAA